MITRRTGYLTISTKPVPEASEQLQREGLRVLPRRVQCRRGAELDADIERVFDEVPPDERSDRYGRRALGAVPLRDAQPQRGRASGRSATRGSSTSSSRCSARTATSSPTPRGARRPATTSHGGRLWHIDSGPHVPRPPDVPWDDRIPYPVFAVAAAHLSPGLPDRGGGPTGVVPRSHTSGQPPPLDRMDDDDLECERRAGGARRWPRPATSRCSCPTCGTAGCRRSHGDPGRYFLQMPLRPARPRATAAADQRREPAVGRGGGTRDVSTGTHASSVCTPRSSTTGSAVR